MVVWVNNPFDNLPVEGYRPQRYWLIAQAFARAGHQVVLWTSDWSHSNKRKRVLNDEQTVTASGMIGPDAHLVMIETPPYRRHVSFERLRSHRAYARNWSRMAFRMVAKGIISQPDVVITSLPPLSTGMTALQFRRKWGCKVICDIQDAWPETFYRVIPLPLSMRKTVGGILFRGFHKMAERMYTESDAVTGVARRYLRMAKEYGCNKPMRLCYHGISLPPNFGRAATVKAIPFNGQRNCFLVYIGNMAKAYDLTTVIRGVRETPGVELHLAGGGPLERHLRLEAKRCPRIFFHGYLRDAALKALLSSADAGIIPMFDDSCVGVPYKLGDYAASGLPVVNSLGGETMMLLANYEAGVKYDAGNVESFKSALRSLISDTSRIPAMRRRMLDMASTEFDAVPIYDSYVEFIEGLFPQNRPDGTPEPEDID